MFEKPSVTMAERTANYLFLVSIYEKVRSLTSKLNKKLMKLKIEDDEKSKKADIQLLKLKKKGFVALKSVIFQHKIMKLN